jgi:hypothetical protein
MIVKLQEKMLNLVRELAKPLDYDDDQGMLILLAELNARAVELVEEYAKNL